MPKNKKAVSLLKGKYKGNPKKKAVAVEKKAAKKAPLTKNFTQSTYKSKRKKSLMASKYKKQYKKVFGVSMK